MTWEMREAVAETLRLCTPLTSLHLGRNGLGEDGGWAVAEALASTPPLQSSTLATTRDTLAQTALVALFVCYIDLGEGGGRALAETLRLNTTLTELFLSMNGLGVEQKSALRQAGATRGLCYCRRKFVSSEGQLQCFRLVRRRRRMIEEEDT